VRKGRASVVVIKDNLVLLIHRLKNGEDYWVLPGGGIEENETGEQAAIRELKEETNLDVTTIKLAYEDNVPWDGNQNFVYLCEISQPIGPVINPEKSKNTESNNYTPQWVEIIKVKDLVVYPESVKNYIESFIK
jgi:8-oxo-dGTP diphosphatase